MDIGIGMAINDGTEQVRVTLTPSKDDLAIAVNGTSVGSLWITRDVSGHLLVTLGTMAADGTWNDTNPVEATQ